MLAEATKLLGTLGVGVLLAFFGLRLYFRQKEYEIVKQRYLEQSLDVIASELEAVSSIFNYNWARCLNLLKEYRDSDEPFDTAKFADGFLDLNGTHFQQAAQHRLQVLTNSQIFWDVYQLALSRHLGLNSVVVNEVPQAVAAQIAGKTNTSKEEMIDAIMVELKPMPRKSDRFAPLHRAILQLTRILEKDRLSFNTLGRFAENPEVKSIVSQLIQDYSSDLRNRADES